MRELSIDRLIGFDEPLVSAVVVVVVDGSCTPEWTWECSIVDGSFVEGRPPCDGESVVWEARDDEMVEGYTDCGVASL